MSTPAAVTVDAFTTHLDKSLTDADMGLLPSYIVAATSAAEGPLGIRGPIVVRSFTSRVDAWGGLLVLPRRPVVSVSSVVAAGSGASYASWGGGGAVTWGGAPGETDELDVDPVSGIVESVGARISSGSYTVTYTAGLAATVAAVDPDIALAVCIIGKHLWETRRGTSGRPGLLGGDEAGVPMGFALPRRAVQLLAPYRSAPSVV